MKILLFTDNHFCSSSSIVRQRGENFSKRLENQVQTLNWLEGISLSEHCDAVVCLGDFFDKSTLNDEELTALKFIEWNNLPHYFLVGNHESSVNGLDYTSAKALQSSTHYVINKPSKIIDEQYNVELCFLPYFIESNRDTLNHYFPTSSSYNKRIIFSHNDIKGLQLGAFLSKDGFDVNEIQESCDLFINGHLHNGGCFANKCYNLGNVTGLNFGEDASRYKHCVAILDTSNLELKFIENPYAFNFYKLEFNDVKDFDTLSHLKNNAIVSIKCKERLLEQCKNVLMSYENKIIYRLMVVKDEVNLNDCQEINDLSVDHLSKFVEFCKEKINNNEILEKELLEICK